MLVNILLFTLVGGFVAVVALGHVLLFNAIWPVFGVQREAHGGAATAGAVHHIHQPN